MKEAHRTLGVTDEPFADLVCQGLNLFKLKKSKEDKAGESVQRAENMSMQGGLGFIHITACDSFLSHTKKDPCALNVVLPLPTHC